MATIPPSADFSPRISVIVCTYNRCKSLLDTLRALAVQAFPTNDWELLIVDNNSKDDTANTVETFRTDNPHLHCRYLFQPRQGLSHARNLGIAEAHGELLLFTDDDVLPEADWIQQFYETMDRAGCDACGGYIAPIWENPPPLWLTSRFHGFLAILMDETGPRTLNSGDDPPFGANMGFKKNRVTQLGSFDTSLGRKGNVLAGGEEWDLFNKIQHAGGRVIYTPRMRVHHKVEAFRLKKAYFRRWRYQGSKNLALSAPPEGSNRLMGIPLYLFAQLLGSILSTARTHITRPPDEAFRQEMIIWHFLGLITGTFKNPLSK